MPCSSGKDWEVFSIVKDPLNKSPQRLLTA